MTQTLTLGDLLRLSIPCNLGYSNSIILSKTPHQNLNYLLLMKALEWWKHAISFIYCLQKPSGLCVFSIPCASTKINIFLLKLQKTTQICFLLLVYYCALWESLWFMKKISRKNSCSCLIMVRTKKKDVGNPGYLALRFLLSDSLLCNHCTKVCCDIYHMGTRTQREKYKWYPSLHEYPTEDYCSPTLPLLQIQRNSGRNSCIFVLWT